VLKKSQNTRWRIDLCNIVVLSRCLRLFVAMKAFIVSYYFIPNPAVEFFNIIQKIRTETANRH